MLLTIAGEHQISLSVGRFQRPYTEDAGLPYFDRAAVIANGKW